jgi:hypothetical protein
MCTKKFSKNPAKYIGELDAARAGEREASHGEAKEHDGHGDHDH